MARDVKFNIKLNIDGRERVVQASTDIRALSDNIAETRRRVRQSADSFEVWTHASLAARNFSDNVSGVIGALSGLTSAWNVQVEAERKLETVMTQRMGATSADIQGIKDLASAQQELGIIGDEVQLAGAQQLATFLNEKSSIEALLPAMNNLLAQQKGLNATGGDAVNIGNLLGKAMQGQTGALSRCGITFSEAQKEVLKFGTEQERAAALAQVVTDNVGEMNARLAATDGGRMQQLSNTFGDWREQMGSVLSSFQPFLLGLSSVVTTVNGAGQAVSSFGAMVRSFPPILAAVASAAAGGCHRAIVGLGAVVTACGQAMRGAAVGATTLKVAIRGLMVATGVGIAIAAVTMAVGHFMNAADDAAGSVKELSAAEQSSKSGQEAFVQAASAARAEISQETAKLQELIKSHGDAEGAVDGLNRKYGEAFGCHKTAKEWYDTLISRSKTYCLQLGYEAQAKSLASRIAELDVRLELNRDKRRDLKKSGKDKETVTTRTPVIDVQTDQVSYITTASKRKTAAMVSAESEQRSAMTERNQLWRELSVVQGNMAASSGKGAGLAAYAADTGAVAGGGTWTGGARTGGAAEEARTLIEDAHTYEELESNVRYYEERLDKVGDTEDAEIARLSALRDAAVAARKAMGVRIGREKGDEPEEKEASFDPSVVPTTRKGYDEAIRFYSEQQETADAAGIEAIQAKIDALTEGKRVLSLGLELRDWERELGGLSGLSDKEFKVKISDGGTAEALKSRLAEINALLADTDKPMDVGVRSRLAALSSGYAQVAKRVDRLGDKEDDASKSVAELGGSLASLGSAVSAPALNIAGTIAQAVANIALSYSQATAQSAAMGPWGWIAFAAAGLAQMVAVISSIKNATAMANGGIVSGATYAYVGEYAGASHNPEVVAPLDRLRGMISDVAGGGIGGDVRFRIGGRELAGVLSNTKKLSGRRGWR